jgi:predicted metal-dependent phosphoesterase TrpH
MDPATLCLGLKNLGLDGAVIAEHDAIWSAQEVADLHAENLGIKLYRGVELSTRHGHFVVIGVNSIDGLVGVPMGKVLTRVHSQSGVVILVHPYRPVRGQRTRSLWPSSIDAVEIASCATQGDLIRQTKNLAERHHWCQVAGSDAHAQPSLGLAYTEFESLPHDERELAVAIRKGLGRPAWSTQGVEKA